MRTMKAERSYSQPKVHQISYLERSSSRGQPWTRVCICMPTAPNWCMARSSSATAVSTSWRATAAQKPAKRSGCLATSSARPSLPRRAKSAGARARLAQANEARAAAHILPIASLLTLFPLSVHLFGGAKSAVALGDWKAQTATHIAAIMATALIVLGAKYVRFFALRTGRPHDRLPLC